MIPKQVNRDTGQDLCEFPVWFPADANGGLGLLLPSRAGAFEIGLVRFFHVWFFSEMA